MRITATASILLTLAPLVCLAGFCPVGQTWPGWDPDWVEPGTITGGQTFCALVDPGESCSCSDGFRLTTTDVFMGLAEDAPVPLTITVSMGLKQAIADPDGPIPWRPGETICVTPIRDFTSYIKKDFVGFGIGLDCECRAMEGPYFLYVTVHSELDPPAGFYTTGDGPPDTGRFLTLVDDEWVDLVATGVLTRGGLVLSGSARCCEGPVATTPLSWGEIKALYR